MVVDAHAKEQFVKEFDAIAIYDKADRRAADLVKILKVSDKRKTL